MNIDAEIVAPSFKVLPRCIVSFEFDAPRVWRFVHRVRKLERVEVLHSDEMGGDMRVIELRYGDFVWMALDCGTPR
jgi:hypothetical protein